MQKNNLFFIVLLSLLTIGINFSLTKKYDFYKASELYKKGKYLKALKIYSIYKKELTNDPRYLFNLGTIYLQIKDYKRSLIYFNLAIKEKPTENARFKIYFNTGVLYYRLNNLEKALLFFKKSAIIEPNNLSLKKNIEILLKQMKKNKKEKNKVKKGEKQKERIIKEPLLNYVNEIEKDSIKSYLGKKKSKKEDKDW